MFWTIFRLDNEKILYRMEGSEYNKTIVMNDLNIKLEKSKI